MAKPSLYLATQNSHKVVEIKDLLGDLFDIHSVVDLGLDEEIPETGQTLHENSLQKAAFIAARYQVTCLADDSGLEVEVLAGAPGVFSARYAGEPKNDQANLQKLLREMEGRSNRSARFVTVLTLHHQGCFEQFEGEVLGEITLKPRGGQGFGYDPVFQADGQRRTFAEMSLVEKNQLAHRARALQKFKSFVYSSRFFQEK